MSLMPSGPGARPKRSWRAFRDNEGRVSPAAVLTPLPTFTGVDHAAPKLARVETQMSWTPRPPARFEENTTSSPSLRTFGWMSLAVASLTPAAAADPPKFQPSPTLGLT